MGEQNDKAPGVTDSFLGLRSLKLAPEYANHRRALTEIVAGCALIWVLVAADHYVLTYAGWYPENFDDVNVFKQAIGHGDIITVIEYGAFVVVTWAGAFSAVVLSVGGAFRIARQVVRQTLRGEV